MSLNCPCGHGDECEQSLSSSASRLSTSGNKENSIATDLNDAFMGEEIVVKTEPEDPESMNEGDDLELQTPLSRIQVTKWIGVATWKWVTNDDQCGICRMDFESPCAECKVPGDDCPLVWGQCSHCFHIHCIMKWLNSQVAAHVQQQQCPLCRQEWKFKE